MLRLTEYHKQVGLLGCCRVDQELISLRNVLLDGAIFGNELPYVAILEGEWRVMHAGASLKRKADEQLSGPTASIRRMETALKGISQVLGTALTNALLPSASLAQELDCVCSCECCTCLHLRWHIHLSRLLLTSA